MPKRLPPQSWRRSSSDGERRCSLLTFEHPFVITLKGHENGQVAQLVLAEGQAGAGFDANRDRSALPRVLNRCGAILRLDREQFQAHVPSSIDGLIQEGSAARIRCGAADQDVFAGDGQAHSAA